MDWTRVDEKEIDVDVSLAATIEERPIIGIRRRARISSSSGERSSMRVAQLMPRTNGT